MDEAEYKPELESEPLYCSYRNIWTIDLNESSVEKFIKCGNEAESFIIKKYGSDEYSNSDEKMSVSL